MKYFDHGQRSGFTRSTSTTTGRVTVDGASWPRTCGWWAAANLYSLLVDNASYEVVLDPTAIGTSLRATHYVRGDDGRAALRGEGAGRALAAPGAGRSQPAPPDGELLIKAPIPGLVVRVTVQPGQEVFEGDTLIILEAMKMENELRAPRAQA